MGEFRYFSSVKGMACQRHGTTVFIGATKTRDGFVWDVDEVVRVPAAEADRNFAAYRMSLLHGELRERSEADYAAWASRLTGEVTRVTPEPEPAAVDSADGGGPQEPAASRASKKRGR